MLGTQVVHCSFCAKADAAVAKVIAGPGVFICDECVGLCVTILADDAAAPRDGRPRLPAWDDLTDEQMLAHVPKIALVASRVENSLREWVGELRRRGATWQQIGDALGMTRQSAWGRFSGEE